LVAGMRQTYQAIAARDGRWWFVQVPGEQGLVTQVHRLDQAEPMLREVIGLMRKVPEDSFDVVIEPDLSSIGELRAVIERAVQERERAAAAQDSASAAIRDAVAQIRASGSIVMVAHDRTFLNRTVARIVEVSRRGAVDYGGNPHIPVYDRYVEERAKAIELAWKKFEEQQAYIQDQEQFIQANKVRKDRAQTAQSRMRMLDKLERLEAPEGVKKVRFAFPQPARSPDLVVGLEGVARRYGPRTVFQGLDLRLHRGEKVALVGVNGAGKSTLLRLAAGVTQPDEGTRGVAEGLRVVYFAQDQFEVLVPDRTAFQHMLDVADHETAPHVRSVLGAFLFGDNDIDKKVAANKKRKPGSMDRQIPPSPEVLRRPLSIWKRGDH